MPKKKYINLVGMEGVLITTNDMKLNYKNNIKLNYIFNFKSIIRRINLIFGFCEI